MNKTLINNFSKTVCSIDFGEGEEYVITLKIYKCPHSDYREGRRFIWAEHRNDIDQLENLQQQYEGKIHKITVGNETFCGWLDEIRKEEPKQLEEIHITLGEQVSDCSQCMTIFNDCDTGQYYFAIQSGSNVGDVVRVPEELLYSSEPVYDSQSNSTVPFSAIALETDRFRCWMKTTSGPDNIPIIQRETRFLSIDSCDTCEVAELTACDPQVTGPIPDVIYIPMTDRLRSNIGRVALISLYGSTYCYEINVAYDINESSITNEPIVIENMYDDCQDCHARIYKLTPCESSQKCCSTGSGGSSGDPSYITARIFTDDDITIGSVVKYKNKCYEISIHTGDHADYSIWPDEIQFFESCAECENSGLGDCVWILKDKSDASLTFKKYAVVEGKIVAECSDEFNIEIGLVVRDVTVGDNNLMIMYGKALLVEGYDEKFIEGTTCDEDGSSG